MEEELLYRVALAMVPGIGDVHAKALVKHFGNARDIFRARKKDLESLEGIGTLRAASIKKFKGLDRAEAELKFIEKFKVIPLFLTDEDYPRRLLNCYDSPSLLYYKGTVSLNRPKVLAIVGTRNYDHYGKMICEEIIQDLKDMDILVVSGLAFGIDTLAHRSSLKNNLPTIGVLAHGLDRIYPILNTPMAKEMLDNGGLLSDFPSQTIPDKQNFPKRNRIVAGMSDAVLVIESGMKGGSLITAELANDYNRDVFAIPGRVTDPRSAGCNFLIQSNKASLITNAAQLIDQMGWASKKVQPKKQKALFIELSAEEKIIFDLLGSVAYLQIDELNLRSGLSAGTVASALLNLEMEGLIDALPGKVYKLN